VYVNRLAKATANRASGHGQGEKVGQGTANLNLGKDAQVQVALGWFGYEIDRQRSFGKAAGSSAIRR